MTNCFVLPRSVTDTRNKILEREIEIADLLKNILESMESESNVYTSEEAARPKENSNAATNHVHESLSPTPNSGLMETNAEESLKNLKNGEIERPVKKMVNMEPPLEEIILRHDDDIKEWWMNKLILHCGIVPPMKNVFRTTSSGIR